MKIFQISEISYLIFTGLTNDLLSVQHQFTLQSALVMKSFLYNLQQPFCFVAHNGNNFDFKVLNTELKRLNQSSKDAAIFSTSHWSDSDNEMEGIGNTRISVTDIEFDSMLCADSLMYLRDVEPMSLGSNSLRSLFQEMFGRSPSNTHTAEGFCNALLSVVQRLSNFQSWAERNAKPMACIEPAY